VSDSGIFRAQHEAWQRGNVQAAAAYLREALAADPANARVKALYEGLLDVLEPTRRVLRMQRELARAEAAARAAERRAGERRTGSDRRQRDIRVPKEFDRRSGVDRRTGKDRRKP
jgi:hypothetical protein